MNDVSPKDCPVPEVHGNPFRYCPYCSWMEEQDETKRCPDCGKPL